MFDEGLGRIVRVQMHAEAPSLEECQRALNAGFMTIHGSIIQRLESTAAPVAVGGGYSDVFSRETEFGDEVFESQVRPDTGAIFYRGRRTISFVPPYDGAPAAEDALQDSLGVLVRGTLVSDDDRIRRIQSMPEAGSVDVVRLMNGVWFVTVYQAGPGLLDAPAEPSPPVVLANGQGGTLREAITETENALESRGLPALV